MNKKIKVFMLSFILFLIDLGSKTIILKSNINYPKTIIENFFYIDKVFNYGAAFSILKNHNVIFIVTAVIMIFVLIKYIDNEVNNKMKFISFSLLISGIIGNLFDRLVYGKVIDFISFKFGRYYFPTFNFADSFIFVGILILLVELIRGDKNGN